MKYSSKWLRLAVMFCSLFQGFTFASAGHCFDNVDSQSGAPLEQKDQTLAKQVEVVPASSLYDKHACFGIIVGINGYQPGIVPLQFAASDAQSFLNVLTLPEFCDNSPSNFFLFNDAQTAPELRPTRANILKKLMVMKSNIVGGDTFFFYFSGHGVSSENENYLICGDSILDLPQDSAIPLSRLYQIISEIDCKRKVVILDACRNELEPGKGDNDKLFMQEKYAAAEGTVTLYSTAMGGRSYEDQISKHGVFTLYLLDGLRGKADLNGDRVISIGELSGFISDQTLSWANSNNKVQKPWIDAKSAGDIPLRVLGVDGYVEYKEYNAQIQPGTSTFVNSSAFEYGIVDSTPPDKAGFAEWSVNPAEAFVYIEGIETAFPANAKVGLAPGLHRVAIVLDGFNSQLVEINVEKGKVAHSAFALTKNDGGENYEKFDPASFSFKPQLPQNSSMYEIQGLDKGCVAFIAKSDGTSRFSDDTGSLKLSPLEKDYARFYGNAVGLNPEQKMLIISDCAELEILFFGNTAISQIDTENNRLGLEWPEHNTLVVTAKPGSHFVFRMTKDSEVIWDSININYENVVQVKKLVNTERLPCLGRFSTAGAAGSKNYRCGPKGGKLLFKLFDFEGSTEFMPPLELPLGSCRMEVLRGERKQEYNAVSLLFPIFGNSVDSEIWIDATFRKGYYYHLIADFTSGKWRFEEYRPSDCFEDMSPANVV